MLPPIDSTARPRSFTIPPQRAWRTSAFQSTMMSAPFSFGSQPQKRPQLSSAHKHRTEEAEQNAETERAVNHPSQLVAAFGRDRTRGGLANTICEPRGQAQ